MSRIRPRGINQYDATRLQGANNYYNLINNKYNTSLTDNNFISSGNNISIQPNDIITNGLLLYLDAGIGNSYPQAGTTWFDLTGNRNNGTLTNGPTYSSSNGGSIVFDGTNDYAGTIINSGLSGSFTFCCFVNVNSITANGAIVTSQFSTNYWAFLGFNPSSIITFALFDTTNNPVAISSTNVTPGTWCYLVGVRNIVTDTISIFFNGISTGSLNDSTTSVPSYSAFNIGGQTNVAGRYANCKIAQVSIYNRALIAAEIQQNFNATRGRFGI